MKKLITFLILMFVGLGLWGQSARVHDYHSSFQYDSIGYINGGYAFYVGNQIITPYIPLATPGMTVDTIIVFHNGKLYYISNNMSSYPNYYVSNDGSDIASGLTPATAWRTIHRVNDTILNPGTTVYFNRGDTWNEMLETSYSGTNLMPITFTSYGSGVDPIFDGQSTRANGIKIEGESFIVIDGIDTKNCTEDGIVVFDWYNVGATNVIIQNCTSTDNGYTGFNMNIPYSIILNCNADDNGTTNNHHGIYMGNASTSNLTYADNFLIENCHASGNSGAGFHLNACGGGTLRYSIAHDNGIQDYGGWGTIAYEIVAGKTVNIYYNVFYNNIYHGINIGYLHAGCHANIWNNTVYYNNQSDYGDGILLEQNDLVSAGNISIKNNLVFSNRYHELKHTQQTTQYSKSNNDWWKTTGNMIVWNGTTYTQAQFATYRTASGDVNSISVDPTVTNAAGHIFTLLTGSPCINAGISVGLTRDYVGNPIVGLPDIGAYEKQ